MTGIELEAALTAFPRSRLCDFATPVHRLPRLERKLNTCWAKHRRRAAMW